MSYAWRTHLFKTYLATPFAWQHESLARQGEAEVSMDTHGWPGAQRSVSFRVHEFVQVREQTEVGARKWAHRTGQDPSGVPYTPACSAAAAGIQCSTAGLRVVASHAKCFRVFKPSALVPEPRLRRAAPAPTGCPVGRHVPSLLACCVQILHAVPLHTTGPEEYSPYNPQVQGICLVASLRRFS